MQRAVMPTDSELVSLPSSLDEFCRAATFLAVDDQLPHLRLLESTLEKWGYHDVHSTTDPRETLPLFLEHQPDIVLLDLNMPGMDGFAVMQQLQGALAP